MFLWILNPDARSADDKSQQTEKESVSNLFIQYTPPMLGKPGKRVGGGTRGSDTEGLTLLALAPDHMALTSKRQPALCWFISRPTDIHIEITLDDGKSIKPILEKRLTKPTTGGVYCAMLSEYAMRLKPGTEYQWFITIIPDPEQRSKDIITGGSVMYREPSVDLAEKLARAGDFLLPGLYARNGFWYDALEGITKLIEERPGDDSLYKMRLQLLDQVGLCSVGDGIHECTAANKTDKK
jgi:hypothetical protein